MKILYTAEATATGGRNGHIKSNNGILDVDVRTPRALGGTDDNYTNPEQLFAGGYAACFDSALNLVIKQGKLSTGETTVTAEVSIGQIENGGFGLAVALSVNIPGVSIADAQALADRAHEVCPYSNATRGNIEVNIIVSNN